MLSTPPISLSSKSFFLSNSSFFLFDISFLVPMSGGVKESYRNSANCCVLHFDIVISLFLNSIKDLRPSKELFSVCSPSDLRYQSIQWLENTFRNMSGKYI